MSVTLSDGDVAQLARQAMNLLDPDVDVRIEPGVSADPYRLAPASWTVRPLFERAPTFGIRLRAGMTPPQALAALVTGLSDGVAQSPRFWARVFPTCGEHEHASEAVVEDEVVVLRCPVEDLVRARLVPDTA